MNTHYILKYILEVDNLSFFNRCISILYTLRSSVLCIILWWKNNKSHDTLQIVKKIITGKKYLIITSKDEIVGNSDKINLRGISSEKNIYIEGESQNIYLNTIKVFYNTYKFNYNVDMSKYPTGWHKIHVIAQRENIQDTLYYQKISQTAGTVITSKTVNIAQELSAINSNGAEKRIIKQYSATGRYFYSEKYGADLYPVDNVSFDENGIIKVGSKYRKKSYYYNAVTIAQHGLYIYYESIASDPKNLSKFLKYADWFVTNQHDDGSYRYPTLNCPLFLPLFPGWVSGMDHGQSLSVLARAYYLTNDARYLEAGYKSLMFMIKDNDNLNNGCTSKLNFFAGIHKSLSHLKDMRISEEYPTVTPVYVLNGNLFALIGLYDWSVISTSDYGKDIAKKTFESGCKTIEILLPYYDFYSYSSYSLSSWLHKFTPNFSSYYAHDCHIFLLNTLYELTGSNIVLEYYDRFKKYVTEQINQ